MHMTVCNGNDFLFNITIDYITSAQHVECFKTPLGCFFLEKNIRSINRIIFQLEPKHLHLRNNYFVIY